MPWQARPDEGVRRLLAAALQVPASAVRLEAGSTSRLKTFLIAGDARALSGRLALLTGQNP
jgi:uncharacterized protein YggU (UPF0235/DUF167 family)